MTRNVTRNLKVISLRVDPFYYTPPFVSGLNYDWKIAFTVMDYRRAVIFMKVISLSKYTQVQLIIQKAIKSTNIQQIKQTYTNIYNSFIL